ncbi:MAG: hypothetical protein JWR09_749 [Mucilaginibacter sp.]|nr:hypothetical protein [Mucilaginibacter sp.]
MLSFTTYQNPEAAVNKLLTTLSIKIDPEIISGELEKHPDYPSLLALSEVLTALNIENAAYHVDTNSLTNVPCPFIAHTNINGGDFLVVNKINGDKVTVSSEKWNNHKINLDEFKKLFKGIVLTAEPSAIFKTTPYTTLLSTIKIPAISAALLLILVLALFNTGYFSKIDWQTVLLTIFKTVGLITSILLLIQSIDSNNPLVQKLCQSGTKTNCNVILTSKAAKVFDGLTWSEVGFFYFSGTWLILLLGGGSGTIWWILAGLNILSLPYTFYSIYYQARIAKQWCVLCCTVQAVLWLEFVPLITIAYKPSFRLKDVWVSTAGTIISSMLIPVILWLIAKPLILKVKQLRPLKQQLRKFKYNTNLFNNALMTQPKYSQPDDTWSIVLGNLKADHIITMVSNPYCAPCAKAHNQLIELLEQRDDLQARIVFTASNTDEDIKTPVSRHLMALNQKPDKTIVKEALHDWYQQKQKTYEAWAKVYPVQIVEADFHKLDKQRIWCEMAEVTATPTMLLNGYRLSDLYQLPDLKYMLE